MGAISLDDILVTPLKRIETLGGDVMHVLKENDKGYAGFGEAYFSWVSEGIVKAWERHTRMTMNVLVPVGQVRFVFCSIRASGAKDFRVEEIGVARYVRVTVPPGIWFGFQGLGLKQSLVLNVASIPHNSDEVEKLAQNDINYVWT